MVKKSATKALTEVNSRGIVAAIGIGLMMLLAALLSSPAAAKADFLDDFSAPMLDQNGDEVVQAGEHPFIVENTIQLATDPTGMVPAGHLRDAIVDMPVGFAGNASKVPTCSLAELTVQQCPIGSRIGTFTLVSPPVFGGATPTSALYNMEPPAGQPARFGTVVVNAGNTYFDVSLRPDDYGIRVSATDVTANLFAWIQGTKVTMWGVPGDPAHNAERGGPAGYDPVPFLTSQTSCDAEPVTRVAVRSWQSPEEWSRGEHVAPMPEDCNVLDFKPEIKVQPRSTTAGEPTAYLVEVAQQLSSSPASLATAHLKDVEVTFPEGVTVNPGLADGLEACSETEIGIGSSKPVECPANSTIGQVKIDTPLLDEPLSGPVFQAEQDQNPFGSTFAIYLNPKNDRYGVEFRLAGEVKLDPETGQLTSTFKDNPQLPFSKLTLNLKGGNRAVLVNPSTCGTKTTQWSISSWARPDDPVSGSDSFTIDRGVAGVPCADAGLGFSPGFSGGTTEPSAGRDTSFALAVSRTDSDQELGSLRSIRLPEGLLGRVGAVPLCGEPHAAAGTCPEDSRIGHVQVAAGAGPSPIWLPEAGKAPTSVSLTGPYRGAPFGLSIVVPAHAGPFNLGKVVVRSALHVDDRTTQLSTGIDEARVYDSDGSLVTVIEGAMPTILKGVPLDLRQIRIHVDRENFMVNPTNCAARQVSTEAVSTAGVRAGLSDRFAAVNCAALDFAPRFRAQIMNKGRRSTLRSFHPRTRFTVAPRKGDANIGAARVILPSSTLLDQANIGTTCTRAQMAARDCPEASIVGHAKAWSPLLRKAVEGPVYLAANGGVRPLPDLAAVMDGEIRVVLQGEIATRRGGGKARLQNTFRVVPDAPVSRFVLTMRGGAKRGLLVNSTDLCRTNERGAAVFRGQNGRTHHLRPRIATAFKGCAKVRRQAARRSTARKAMARRAAIRSAAREVR